MVVMVLGFSMLTAMVFIGMRNIIRECNRVHQGLEVRRENFVGFGGSGPVPCPSCKTLVKRGKSPCPGCGVGLRW